MSNGMSREELAAELARLERARKAHKGKIDVLARSRARQETIGKRQLRAKVKGTPLQTRAPFTRFLGGAAGLAPLLASNIEATTGKSFEAPWASKTRGWAKGLLKRLRSPFGGGEPAPEWTKHVTPGPAPKAERPTPTATPIPAGVPQGAVGRPKTEPLARQIERLRKRGR